MIKTYVLDTNVLIQAPHALFSFEDNNIVLPFAVVEELDHLKSEDGERGANARAVIRTLDKLRQKGDLVHGVPLPEGGTLRMEPNYTNITLPESWKPDYADNRILKVCKGMHQEGTPAILVSRDILVRIKADMLGITAEDFTTDQAPQFDEQYKGRRDVYCSDETFTQFRKKGIPLSAIFEMNEDNQPVPVDAVLNEFFIIHAAQSCNKTLLGRYDGNAILPLRYIHEAPFGVHPRNVGQKFLQEALMADTETAPLVIVKGVAGTAKTFYALAVGLQRVFEEKEFRKIMVSRPNVLFDEDIGFLPGTEQEKIAPLLRPIIDNLEVLFDLDDRERYRNERELKSKVDELFERGVIIAEAMNFIRGRSITHTFLIIDEAQNLTPKQAKGIITRAGKGTKVILLGDPQQIDHPLLDVRTNGLSYAAEKMKGSPLCWQITMQPDECERSPLAADSAQRM